MLSDIVELASYFYLFVVFHKPRDVVSRFQASLSPEGASALRVDSVTGSKGSLGQVQALLPLEQWFSPFLMLDPLIQSLMLW